MSSVDGLVSTIIPVYNRPVLLRQAVQSVIAQTYRPIEVIIVDDGSTDDTRRIADRFTEEYPPLVHVIHQGNKGAALAREAGRQAARGEFVQYLDSDDVLLPHKFELQVSHLRKQPECGVAYGKTSFCESIKTTAQIAWKRTGERIEWMFPSFLQSRWWGTSTPLYRTVLTDSVGPWLSLSNEEDWEYDCRLARSGVRLCYVPEFVSEEREHGGHRLSREGSSDLQKLRDRAVAHNLIYGHAIKAGIGHEYKEMQHFARELFLLARQCGANGLTLESKQLFSLAKTASGEQRARGLDFRLYEVLAQIAGWENLGRFTCYSDRFRR